MRHIIKYIAALAVGVLSLACSEDYNFDEDGGNTAGGGGETPEYVEPSISWSTSAQEGNENPVKVLRGTSLTVEDASEGTLTHAWSISPVTGVYFLQNSIPFGQVADESDLTPFFLHTNSKDKVLNYYFQTAGTRTITLRNTYAEELEGTTQINNTEQWQFSKQIQVDVYDDVMAPALKAFKDAERTIPFESDEIEVVLGESVYFTDASTDRPTNREVVFIYNGVEQEPVSLPSANFIFTPTFSTMGSDGELDAFTVKYKVSREGNETTFIPAAAAVEAILPLAIKVKPIFSFTRSSATVVQLKVGAGKTFKGSFDASQFKVDYVNNYNGANMSGSVAVQSVAVNAQDASLLDITVETTYNTDDLYCYTDGEIANALSDDSALNIAKSSFADIKADYIEYVNDTFEDVALGEDAGWLKPSDKAAAELSVIDNPTTDGLNTSSKCIRLSGLNMASAGLGMGMYLPLTDVAKADFTVTFKHYIPNSAANEPHFTFLQTAGSASMAVHGTVLDAAGNVTTAPASNLWFGGAFGWAALKKDTAKDVWLTTKFTKTSIAELDNAILALVPWPFNGEMYIDDIVLGNAETRP